MSVYLKDGSVLLNSGSVAIDSACCCGGCHGLTTCNVSFIFTYQDNPAPPIGHAFSGTGSFSFDVSTCVGNGATVVSVTVVDHEEFFDITCEPDAAVGLTARATYDSMSGLWSVEAAVLMGDHATVCGPGGWPTPDSILSDVADTLTDAGGTLTLVPETIPNMTGLVTFAFS